MRMLLRGTILACVIIAVGCQSIAVQDEDSMRHENSAVAPMSSAHPDRMDAIKTLKSWTGVDFRKIPKSHRHEIDAATSVLSGTSTDDFESFVPWFFWDISERPVGEKVKEKYVFMEMQETTIIPGGSSVRVTVLDGHGSVLGVSVLNTGWRADPNAAILEWVYDYSSGRGRLILQINHIALINGSEGRQFYGLIDNKFYFLRVEDPEGMVFRNDYSGPNLMFGQGFAPESVDACLAMLRDKNRLVHLRAAAWLGGIHFVVTDPTKPSGYEVYHEDEKAAWIAHLCYESPEIRTQLEKLAHSEQDQWTRDAAKQALNPVFPNH